jgi:hypothetical protein
MQRSKPSTTRPAQPLDPEAELFARIVGRVFSWRCKKCGMTGICDCFEPAGQPAPSNAFLPLKGDGVAKA